MTINLEDVQQWSPESVEQLAKAATSRALQSKEKARALPSLSVFESWDGESRDAAHGATVKIAAGLEMSGLTAAKVAIGAGKVVPEVRELKNQLAALLHDAQTYPSVGIDLATNTVIPPDTTGCNPVEVARLQAKITDLEFRISTILGAAETIDAELAAILHTAVGEGPAEPGEFPKEVGIGGDMLEGGSKQGEEAAKAALESGAVKSAADLRTLERVEKSFKVLGKLGKAAGAAAFLSDAADTYSKVRGDLDEGKSLAEALVNHVPEGAGGIAGGAGGAEVGGLAGAAIGTAIFPVVGTVIGGAVGAVGGGLLGSDVGERAGKVVTNGIHEFQDDLNHGKSILEATVHVVPHVNDAINAIPQELVKDAGEKAVDLGKKAIHAIGEALD